MKNRAGQMDPLDGVERGLPKEFGKWSGAISRSFSNVLL